MQDLKGKIILVTGVVNKRSIAFASAEALAARGAVLVISYLPTGRENEKEKIEKLTESFQPKFILPLDASDSDSIASLFKEIKKKCGKLNVLIHSIANAKREELNGKFSDTTLDGYQMAHHISSYSLIELVRVARPLFDKSGGSVITMTYIGSDRVIKNYNVMGSAKAALESNVRYLAHELGPDKIRVNAISAGPIRTLASSGIKDFLNLLHQARDFSALKRNITKEEVANTVAFLSSDLSSGITGQVLFVDGGFNSYG